MNCGIGDDSWESVWLQGGPTSPSQRKPTLSVHWKDWCWSWSSNILVTWYEELTHGKDHDYGKDLGQEEKGKTGWNGWMASQTHWTWVWGNFWRFWSTGWPGMLRCMGLQRVGHNWVTEWTEHYNGRKQRKATWCGRKWRVKRLAWSSTLKKLRS